MEDRVDQLVKLKREEDALSKAKQLFHLSTSFVSILVVINGMSLLQKAKLNGKLHAKILNQLNYN